MMASIETIANDDLLYRRLLYLHIKPTGQISSAAFKNKRKKPDPEPSVDLARLTTPERCLLLGLPGMKLGQLKAEVPFGLGLGIEHRPTNDNNAHCVITGNHTLESCRRLAEATMLVRCDVSGLARHEFSQWTGRE